MTVRALVYSHDIAFCRYVGDSLDATANIEFVASYPVLFARLNAGVVDVVILDGEATPAGGVDVARQLKDRFNYCPPILLVVARAADAWLALMSKADATVGPGRAPMPLADAVNRLMKELRPATSRCRR